MHGVRTATKEMCLYSILKLSLVPLKTMWWGQKHKSNFPLSQGEAEVSLSTLSRLGNVRQGGSHFGVRREIPLHTVIASSKGSRAPPEGSRALGGEGGGTAGLNSRSTAMRGGNSLAEAALSMALSSSTSLGPIESPWRSSSTSSAVGCELTIFQPEPLSAP